MLHWHCCRGCAVDCVPDTSDLNAVVNALRVGRQRLAHVQVIGAHLALDILCVSHAAVEVC